MYNGLAPLTWSFAIEDPHRRVRMPSIHRFWAHNPDIHSTVIRTIKTLPLMEEVWS